MKKFLVFFLSTFFFAFKARAECVPPEGGKCLNYIQFEQLKAALRELDSIKKSPAVVTTAGQIIIIRDWDGRVYVNGGEKEPLKMKLTIGETVDRDLAVVLPTQILYRPKPPDPMFRLRIRAQIGILALDLPKTSREDFTKFLDAGIGWDFVHYKEFNLSAYTGIRSAGAQIGMDLTRNFGPFVGYSMVYDGFRPNVLLGTYWSFNLWDFTETKTRCRFDPWARKNS